jgi:5-methylcytosine-specific restriction endonuclease McrA
MTPTQAEARRLIDEARERGDTYYFTGVPCKRGHIAPRYVSTFNCAECRRTYGRKHDMKYKASTKYKRAMRRSEQSEKGKVSQKRRDRSYRDTEKGRAVVRIQCATRAAAGSIPALAIIQIFGRAKKCYICGKRFTKANPPTLDHVRAVADTGTNHPGNLAAAHGTCNSSKGKKRTHLL